MGISLQDYRIQIGLYNLSGRNKQMKIRKHGSTKNLSNSFFIFFLIYLFVCDAKPQFSPSSKRIPAGSNTYYMACSSPSSVITTATMNTTADIVNSPITFLRWSHSIQTNGLCHALTGNRRRLGYKLALWNCRKGLLGDNNFDSNKFIEIKLFIEKHRPHTFGIIESDIHSLQSRV